MWVKYPDNKPSESGFYEITYISKFPCNPLIQGTSLDLRGKYLTCIIRYDCDKEEWEWGLLIPSGDVVAYNPKELSLNDEAWSPDDT